MKLETEIYTAVQKALNEAVPKAVSEAAAIAGTRDAVVDAAVGAATEAAIKPVADALEETGNGPDVVNFGKVITHLVAAGVAKAVAEGFVSIG